MGHVEGCDMCRDQPVSVNARPSRGSSARKLCVGCDRALRGGAQLKELGSKDSKFQEGKCSAFVYGRDSSRRNGR